MAMMPERDAHAAPQRRLERGLGEEVHVVEAGDAAAQHLGAGEQRAVVHELAGRRASASAGQMCSCSQRMSGRSSDRPRMSAHRRMRVRVDEARDQGVPRQVERLVAGVGGRRGAGREDRLDPARRAPRRRDLRAPRRPARPALPSGREGGRVAADLRHALYLDHDAAVGRQALDERLAVLLVGAGLHREGLAEAQRLDAPRRRRPWRPGRRAPPRRASPRASGCTAASRGGRRGR